MLNIHVERDINENVHSNFEEARDIKICVGRYSKLDRRCCFSELLYKIWQAFLSVFGCADWQKGCNAIASTFTKLIEKQLLLQISTDPQIQATIRTNSIWLGQFRMEDYLAPALKASKGAIYQLAEKNMKTLIEVNDLNLPREDTSYKTMFLQLMEKTGQPKDILQIIETVAHDMMKLLIKAVEA